MALTALVAMSACAPMPNRPARPARSTLACIEAAMAGHEFDAMNDKQAHCLAAGLIARQCSVTEAMLASIGKEIEDVFGAGDAQWRDLAADRHGLHCGRTASSDAQIVDCCAAYRH
jgi:hypothetical protein